MSELERHVARIGQLVSELGNHPDAGVRDKAVELVEHFDHLHRTCVWRLFELTTELGGKGLVDRIAADPAVKLLFQLYDLISTQPLQAVAGSALTSGFVPAVRGTWTVTFERADLRPGLHAVEVEGTPVVLCVLGEEVFAYRNFCPGVPLPLHLGALADGEIRCPWHGCRFDARSGKRVGGSGPDLQSFFVEPGGSNVTVSARGDSHGR